MITSKDAQMQLRQKIINMSASERENLEVYAVSSGCNVQYSSCFDCHHTHYQLDFCIPGVQHAWCPFEAQLG
jgi:hypothetical protein